MLIYSALYTFLLLISTSLVAEKGRQFRRGVREYEVSHHEQYEDTCDYYGRGSRSSCGNVEAAVVRICHKLRSTTYSQSQVFPMMQMKRYKKFSCYLNT